MGVDDVFDEGRHRRRVRKAQKEGCGWDALAHRNDNGTYYHQHHGHFVSTLPCYSCRQETRCVGNRRVGVGCYDVLRSNGKECYTVTSTLQ